MKTAREKHKIELVKQKILDGALSIITQKGFANLTMRSLAKEIGMTAPNIYNYFSGKDELYINIVIKGFQMLHTDLEKAYNSCENGIKRIRRMMDSYVAFGIEKPRYYDIMFTLQTPKHNNYVGTKYEKLSEIEYDISMKIAALALKAASSMKNISLDRETAELKMLQAWSLLHGMVALYNSQVVKYVVEKAERSYSKLIDEFIESIQNYPHK